MAERISIDTVELPGWDALTLGERLVAVARRLAHEDVSTHLAECCHADIAVDGEEAPSADSMLLSLAVAARKLETRRRQTGHPREAA